MEQDLKIVENIPTVEQLFRIAPITLTVLIIGAVVGYGVYVLMNRHIKDLKEFIDYFKNKGN